MTDLRIIECASCDSGTAFSSERDYYEGGGHRCLACNGTGVVEEECPLVTLEELEEAGGEPCFEHDASPCAKRGAGRTFKRRRDKAMNSMFATIVSCIDASAAQARADQYRQLMLHAEKLEAIAYASHSQEVLEECYRVANRLREEAHAIDVTDMRDIDTDAQELEGTSW